MLHITLWLKKIWGKNEVEQSQYVQIRKAEFLVVGGACTAIFWPILNFYLYISAEGNLISVHLWHPMADVDHLTVAKGQTHYSTVNACSSLCVDTDNTKYTGLFGPVNPNPRKPSL